MSILWVFVAADHKAPPFRCSSEFFCHECKSFVAVFRSGGGNIVTAPNFSGLAPQHLPRSFRWLRAGVTGFESRRRLKYFQYSGWIFQFSSLLSWTPGFSSLISSLSYFLYLSFPEQFTSLSHGSFLSSYSRSNCYERCKRKQMVFLALSLFWNQVISKKLVLCISSAKATY